MRMTDLRPPRIALALTLVAAALHRMPVIWDEFRYSAPRAGAAIAVIGFSLMIWSWGLLKLRNAPVCLPAGSTVLITDGPYRCSRNPMYLGMVLMTLGLALYVGTPPFYFAAAAYFIIINFDFCPFEEDKLAKAFGDAYTDYRSRVRRWL